MGSSRISTHSSDELVSRDRGGVSPDLVGGGDARVVFFRVQPSTPDSPCRWQILPLTWSANSRRVDADTTAGITRGDRYVRWRRQQEKRPGVAKHGNSSGGRPCPLRAGRCYGFLGAVPPRREQLEVLGPDRLSELTLPVHHEPDELLCGPAGVVVRRR
jgi:hypothetical protein